MNTSINHQEYINKAIANWEKVINVCNKELDYFNHPEIYGCCLCSCNSIVINIERMMVITTDETHHTTYCFNPLYPTRFTPDAARRIVRDDVYKDVNDNKIKLEIIGERKYYELLKEKAEESLNTIKSLCIK